MKLLQLIVDMSLQRRALVLALAGALLAAGLDAARTLPIDAVPDVTNVQVQVMTSAPALSPIEIEQYVSVPVERAMAGLPRLREIRSISRYGVSVVTVVFQEGTNIYFARQMVSERMGEARDAVPQQSGKPEMGPVTTALGEVFQFVVEGEGHKPMELEETLDWFITPQLRLVPGVVEVLSFGGEDKQYQVIIDPARLQAAGLGLSEVVKALASSNANVGGGYIERNRETIVIGTEGLLRSLADLESVVVGSTRDGAPIMLTHIAEVRLGVRLRHGAASIDGRMNVAVGTVLMLMGENARTVTEGVKEKLAELAPSLPKGMRVTPFYDRSVLVDRTIRTVLTNLAEGALLVILVLFALLGDVRAGLIVAFTIPLAMSIAVIAMRALGLSGNLMSLGAIDFGLIVDGAVIIVENSLRRLAALPADASTDARTQCVRVATLEVRTASFVGELIIAIVYLPILSLQGVEGKLFTPMATTVLLALAGAFLCSLSIVPVLCALYLKPGVHHETRLLAWVKAHYLPLRDMALAKQTRTIVIGALLLIAGGVCFALNGTEFIPQLDEGDLLVEARRLPSVALSESIAGDKRMQEALLQIPEIAHVVSKTGSPELALDPMGVDQSDLYLSLKPRAQWRPGLDKAGLAALIERTLDGAVPDVAPIITQPIQMRSNELLAGVRSDVAAEIYGPDLTTLRSLGLRVAAVLKEVDGAVDVHMEQGVDIPYLQVLPDRAKLARYGLRIFDVNELTETIAVGRRIGYVFEGDRRFEMIVKMKLSEPVSEQALAALPLQAPSGRVVPLGDVASLVLRRGPALVNRDRQSRRLLVEFNVRGRGTVSTVAEAERLVGEQVELPPGYRIVWGGQFRHYAEARDRLLVVVPLCLMLIFALLWVAFHQLRSALLIFANIPFAATGGAIALFARGIPFSISAGVGFIALFGVAVLNGLVLVSFARERERAGESALAAITAAAELRLRPVLMTAGVAALGFLPMALASAPGSEVQRPLATVVIGGLISASALTLLFFPALYAATARAVPKQEG